MLAVSNCCRKHDYLRCLRPLGLKFMPRFKAHSRKQLSIRTYIPFKKIIEGERESQGRILSFIISSTHLSQANKLLFFHLVCLRV